MVSLVLPLAVVDSSIILLASPTLLLLHLLPIVEHVSMVVLLLLLTVVIVIHGTRIWHLWNVLELHRLSVIGQGIIVVSLQRILVIAGLPFLIAVDGSYDEEDQSQNRH